MLTYILPVLSLILTFAIFRIWLLKVIMPLAKSSKTTIMRWRLFGHFYNSGAIYGMLKRLSYYDYVNRQKYQRMITTFIVLHLLMLAALAWTIWSIVNNELHEPYAT